MATTTPFTARNESRRPDQLANNIHGPRDPFATPPRTPAQSRYAGARAFFVAGDSFAAHGPHLFDDTTPDTVTAVACGGRASAGKRSQQRQQQGQQGQQQSNNSKTLFERPTRDASKRDGWMSKSSTGGGSGGGPRNGGKHNRVPMPVTGLARNSGSKSTTGYGSSFGGKNNRVPTQANTFERPATSGAKKGGGKRTPGSGSGPSAGGKNNRVSMQPAAGLGRNSGGKSTTGVSSYRSSTGGKNNRVPTQPAVNLKRRPPAGGARKGGGQGGGGSFPVTAPTGAEYLLPKTVTSAQLRYLSDDGKKLRAFEVEHCGDNPRPDQQKCHRVEHEVLVKAYNDSKASKAAKLGIVLFGYSKSNVFHGTNNKDHSRMERNFKSGAATAADTDRKGKMLLTALSRLDDMARELTVFTKNVVRHVIKHLASHSFAHAEVVAKLKKSSFTAPGFAEAIDYARKRQNVDPARSKAAKEGHATRQRRKEEERRRQEEEASRKQEKHVRQQRERQVRAQERQKQQWLQQEKRQRQQRRERQQRQEEQRREEEKRRQRREEQQRQEEKRRQRREEQQRQEEKRRQRQEEEERREEEQRRQRWEEQQRRQRWEEQQRQEMYDESSSSSDCGGDDEDEDCGRVQVRAYTTSRGTRVSSHTRSLPRR